MAKASKDVELPANATSGALPDTDVEDEDDFRTAGRRFSSAWSAAWWQRRLNRMRSHHA